MATIEAARTALAEAFGDRRILLVVDDVWQKQHLDRSSPGRKREQYLEFAGNKRISAISS